MRRFLASAALLGLFALPVVGLVGCGEEAGTKTTTETKTPGGGTDKVTSEVKETKTGDAKDGAPAPAPAPAP